MTTNPTAPAKRRGRPPVDDPWTKYSVRMRVSDVARLRAAAGGMPVSEFARAAIMAAIERG